MARPLPSNMVFNNSDHLLQGKAGPVGHDVSAARLRSRFPCILPHRITLTLLAACFLVAPPQQPGYPQQPQQAAAYPTPAPAPADPEVKGRIGTFLLLLLPLRVFTNGVPLPQTSWWNICIGMDPSLRFCCETSSVKTPSSPFFSGARTTHTTNMLCGPCTRGTHL